MHTLRINIVYQHALGDVTLNKLQVHRAKLTDSTQIARSITKYISHFTSSSLTAIPCGMHSSSGHQARRRYASLFPFLDKVEYSSLSRLRNSDFLLCNLHPHIQAPHISYHGLPSYSNCAPKTSSSSIEPRTTRFSADWCLLELDYFHVLNRTGCHIVSLYVYPSCIILPPLFSRSIPEFLCLK